MSKFIHSLSIGILLLLPTYGECAPAEATSVDLQQSALYTDGERSIQEFVTDSIQAGSYHIGLWTLPSRITEGDYTPMDAYVNGNYVGQITADTDNWQCLYIADGEPIYLENGRNSIAIATPLPDVPSVEFVRLGMSLTGASISAEVYDEYMLQAAAQTSMMAQTYAMDEPMETTSSTTFPMLWLGNALKYTFLRNVTKKEGERLKVKTQSMVPHCIDVIYMGEPIQIIWQPTFPRRTSSLALDTLLVQPALDLKTQFTPATDEEMQGLGWIGESEGALVGYVATTDIKIPKFGLYAIRVRSRDSGVLSTVNVSIEGVGEYEDMPLYHQYLPVVMPPAAAAFEIQAWSDTENADPVLIVHGADADRAVGYNDDRPSALSDRLPQRKASYLQQRYRVRTSGVSVSNYSSSNPETTCTIMISYAGSVQAPMHQTRTAESATASGAVLETSLPLSATAYDVMGMQCAYAEGEDAVAQVTQALAGRSGVYVIAVETAEGIYTYKIHNK